MDKTSDFYGKEKPYKVILKLAPPVMLAQLIQALYNIVDSFFVGKYSGNGLTALSIIYPLQLLMIAFAVGTGVGINTRIAYALGLNKEDEAKDYAGIGPIIAIVLWIIFALVTYLIMPTFAKMSTSSPVIIDDVVTYGRIVCVFSFGVFFESIWSKILQARGDMKTPMIGQIVGAIVNIILDPILIFGLLGFKEMGIAGAAIATVIGQMCSALIVMRKALCKTPRIGKYKNYIKNIYISGIPNILMQSAYTFYILGLNLILSTFSDQAVTALGLYYKWQTFFFIPLGALQTCMVPIVSYNYATNNIDRCKQTLNVSLLFGLILMFIGTLCFELIPSLMLSVFTKDDEVIRIGTIGFRFIGVSFIPMVTSLIYPVFFQAVSCPVKSSLLTVIRTVILFVPLGYLFSRFGLNYFWLTFIFTEVITSVVGYILYKKFIRKNRKLSNN